MQRQGILGLTTGIGLVALCAAAVIYGRRVPAPQPQSAPATAFSAARAMRHVRALSQSPRPAGSAAHERARAYLEREFARLGLSANIQDVTGVGTRYAVAGRVRNVLVRLPGSSSAGRGPAVLLASHYDGVPAGPAAGDAASGTAVLLETLRALLAGPPLRNDVIALFTDSEENGLLGAAAFVRDHPWAKDVAVVINFEARGTFGPSFMFETGAGNLDVVRALWHVRGARATSLSTAVYRRLPNDTDLSELLLLDRPSLNFAFIGGVQRYHTAEDDVAHLDAGSVQHHGNSAVALARIFGDEPLPRPKTGDAVFFEVPLIGLILYPASWALPVAVVAFLLVVVVVVRVRREPRLLRDTLIGALVMVIAVALSGVAGFAIATGITAFHGAKPLGGSPAWSGTYLAAVALLAFAIASASYATARRWIGPVGAHVGALAAWALLAVLVAYLEPGASWLFVWPLVAAAAVALAPATRPRLSLSLGWIATAFVIFVIVPTIYTMVGMALGLDAVGATILAVFTALGAWLLTPRLEILRGSRPALAPAIAAGVAALLFNNAALTVRTLADDPVGVSLAYAVDSDSSQAWFTGFGNAPSARSWLRQALDDSSAGRPGQAMPLWLTRGFDARVTRPATFTSLAPPSATVVRDSLGTDARHVTLRVLPAPGTLVLSMAVDGAVLSASVNGMAVDTSRYRRPRRWPLQFIAPPDSGFVLSLRMRPGVQSTLGLMATIDTVPSRQRFQIPRRPDGILPYQNGDVSLVYRRVHLLRDSTGK